MPRIWELIRELAVYEKLLPAVSGCAEDLARDLFGVRPACECWVASAEDHVVGYALTYSTYSTFRTKVGVWLEDLYVTPDRRGHGYGKALISAVFDSARATGAGRVEWSVLDWNAPAISFYERLGATVLPDWRICRLSL